MGRVSYGYFIKDMVVFCSQCFTAAGFYDWSDRNDWLHTAGKTLV